VPLNATGPRALLARLALSPNVAVSRGALFRAIWGEHPPDAAASLLQCCVARLRRTLRAAAGAAGHALVQTVPGGYRLAVAPEQLDLLRFRSALAGSDDIATLDVALELWRGRPVADVETLAEHPVVVLLADEHVDAVLRLADVADRLGEHVRAVHRLRHAAALHPMHERLHAKLMVCLAGAGRQAEALAVYDDVRARLSRDLGIDPGPDLLDSQLRVLRQRWAGDPQIPPPPPLTVPPAQLPSAMTGFVGRAAELERLTAAVERRTTATQVVVTGPPGVGKTTLVVHWAHLAVERFPAGQLYLDLRGFDPGGADPLTPSEAVSLLLEALGVPPTQCPDRFATRVGLYRTLLAQQRMLIVLDNARDADQVRPLLPGSAGTVAVVVSRDRLDGLVASTDADILDLRLLTSAEARDLLSARVGAGRTGAEPAAVARIVARCANLPLALAVVAARARIEAEFPLAAIADRLDETDAGLSVFDGGDAATNVTAAFSWSYRALSPAAARAYRLVGLHPGPGFSAAAAASLLAESPARTREVLGELVRAHLLTAVSPTRYALHDLLRAYAADLARHGDGGEDQAALHRMVEHYLHSAHLAARRTGTYPLVPDLPPAPPTIVVAELRNAAEGQTYFVTEQAALLAVARHADRAGLDTHARELAERLTVYLHRSGLWDELSALQRAVVAAARRRGDRQAEGDALRVLARAAAEQGSIDRAYAYLTEAVGLYRQIGSRASIARAYCNMAAVLALNGRPHEALAYQDRAIATGGDPSRPSSTHWGSNRAHILTMLGRHEEALADGHDTLRDIRVRGDLTAVGAVLDTIGLAHHGQGDQLEAIRWYRQALDHYHQFEYRRGEATVRHHLGDALRAAGDVSGAADAYRQSLDMLRALRHHEASQVRAKLCALSASGG
jgi:DNA-binding SARP family transcriptional activator/tetratricopeptide (TPR) repeat protein